MKLNISNFACVSNSHFSFGYIPMFLVVATILNFGSLAGGENGYFRVMDVTDMYFDKVKFLSLFWLDADGHGWFPSPLFGWPAHIGSIGPQHLTVILSLIFGELYAFLLFRLIIDFLSLAGFFIFLRKYLRLDEKTSFLCAVAFCASYYWYDENIVVTAGQLLPLAMICTGMLKNDYTLKFGCRVLFAILFFSASIPAYSVPIVPVFQSILFFILKKRLDPKRTAITFFTFWSCYLIFHYSSISDYLNYNAVSNRSLWNLMPIEAYGTLVPLILSHLHQDTFIYPTIIFLLFTKTDTAKILVLTITSAFTLLLLACLQVSQEYILVLKDYQIFNYLNSTLHRCLNFVPFVICLGSAIILQNIRKSDFVFSATGLRIIVFFGLMYWVFETQNHRALEEAVISGIILYFCLFVICGGIKTGSKFTLLFVSLFILVPLKYKDVSFRETPQVGNLYVDKFVYAEDGPYRVVTLMPNHFSSSFFPAQASVRKQENFDGFSVFYGKSDALFWQDNIASKTQELVDNFGYEFANWNNRIELTVTDFRKNSEYFINLFKQNNVRFIRTLEELNSPNLTLREKVQVTYEDKEGFAGYFNPFNSRKENKISSFLYEIKNYFPRLYILEKNQKENTKSSILDFSRFNNLNITSYTPSHIIFEASTQEDEKIKALSNFDKNWHLNINGKPAQDRIRPDKTGLIEITPEIGLNTYELYFSSKSKIILFEIFLACSTIILFFARNGITRKTSNA